MNGIIEPLGLKRAEFKPKGMHHNLYDRDVQLFVRNLMRNVKEKFKDTLAKYLQMASHMINPEGCCKYRTAAGAVKRVRVRGLIYCRKCHVQWARDFSAALNIGYAFAYAMSLESWERPRYLSAW